MGAWNGTRGLIPSLDDKDPSHRDPRLARLRAGGAPESQGVPATTSRSRPYTADGCLLLVNAGLDPERPLETQFDSFWWGGEGFSRITEPYGQFRKVVRGFEPHHPGLVETDYTLTVDAGCGFGGALMAACLTSSGDLVDRVEA